MIECINKKIKRAYQHLKPLDEVLKEEHKKTQKQLDNYVDLNNRIVEKRTKIKLKNLGEEKNVEHVNANGQEWEN